LPRAIWAAIFKACLAKKEERLMAVEAFQLYLVNGESQSEKEIKIQENNGPPVQVAYPFPS
jgi:hypothetical protein